MQRMNGLIQNLDEASSMGPLSNISMSDSLLGLGGGPSTSSLFPQFQLGLLQEGRSR